MSEVSIVSSAVEMGTLGRGSEMRIDSPAIVGVITQTSESNLSPSGRERVHKFMSSQPCLVKFLFLIPLLMEVLQVAYQSNSRSPFDTHPANMWASIITASIYCFAFAATNILQSDTSYYLLVGYVTLFSGALSSISIVSIFLPHWLGWLIFIMWFLLLVMVVCDLHRDTCKSFYEKTKKKLLDIWNRFVGRNLTEQPVRVESI